MTNVELRMLPEMPALELLRILVCHRFTPDEDRCQCGEFIEYLGGNDVDRDRWQLWAEHVCWTIQ